MTYTVTIAGSGSQFPCDQDTQILQAGLNSGLFLPYSCRSGMCSTCRGRVVKGTVDLCGVHPAYLPQSMRDAGYALLCQAKPCSDITIEVEEIDPSQAIRSKYMPVRVIAMDKLSDDVMLVKLGFPMNEPMRFRAGQYLEFVGKDGARRSYSIANAPKADGVRQVELHIRHIPNGHFSGRVFRNMSLREVHKIEFPMGSFFLREKTDKQVILLASGTGFAPIKAILEDVFSRNVKRSIILYWGGRRLHDLYMKNICDKWAKEFVNFKFVPVLSEPSAACHWQGRTGLVHQAVLSDFPSLAHAEVYACGTPLMVEAARRDLVEQAQLPVEAFFADSFLTSKEKAAV